MNELENKLEKRKIKPTTMRLLVRRKLVESGSAISLMELDAKFEQADKATLYRTLKTFESSRLYGLSRQTDDDQKQCCVII